MMKRRQRFWMKGGPHPTLSARVRLAGTALLVGGVCLGATPVEAQPLPRKVGPRRIVAREERLWRDEAWWKEGPRWERAESGVVRRRGWEYPKGRPSPDEGVALLAVFPPFEPLSFGLSNVGRVSKPELVDIDADGDLDSFISGFTFGSGDSIFIFENTGSASAPAFAPPQANPFGLSGSDPAFADIDADGDADAFVGNGGDTMFFENTGTPSEPAFAAPQTNPFGLSGVGYDSVPEFADIDSDGDLDAFIGNRDGDTMFFENTGTPSGPAFAAPQTNPFGLTDVYRFNAPDFADLDADGDFDAFIGNWYGNAYFFENTGAASAPAFASPQMNPFGLPDVGDFSVPEFADIDSDGDLDAFIGEYFGKVIFFENTGTVSTPAFVATQVNPFGLTDVGYNDSSEFVDIDADGDLDAFIGDIRGTTFFFENTGTPSIPAFAAPVVNPFGLYGLGSNYRPYNGADPSFADIDGDGDFDVFDGEYYGATYFFENTGTASVPAFAALQVNPFGLSRVGYAAIPDLADMDADGDLDAFITCGVFCSAGYTYFFENTGTPSIPAFAAPVVNPFGLQDVGFGSSPELVDLDADGDIDVFIAGPYSMNFYENTGNPSDPAFTSPLANPFGVTYQTRPDFADIDADGDLDAFISDSHGNTIFLENTSAPGPTDTTPPECRLERVDSGPPAVLEVLAQDTGSGLASITVLTAENADVSGHTGFPSGTTEPVLVTATKLDQSEKAVLALEVKDVAGNSVTCDPVVDQVSPEVPAAFSLEANYPNPFNLQTAIPFQLPEGARVRLSVYDVLGREVAVLVDEEMAPGTYEAQWSAASLPSGVYFYRIEAGSFRATGRMTLAR